MGSKKGAEPTILDGKIRHKRGQRQTAIYECLKGEILTLALKPGEALDETRLAKSFSTSRAPVREALIRLSADGLVKILPNRSTLVSPLDLVTVQKWLDALSLLQRFTHRLAARHHNPAQLEKAEAARDRIISNLKCDDPGGAIAADSDFHLALGEGCGNPYLVSAYQRILNEGVRIQHMCLAHSGWNSDECGIQDHDDMLVAMQQNDELVAEELARKHARHFESRITRLLATTDSERIEIVD